MVGPEEIVEKTPEVGPAMDENVESAQETEPITVQVPSVERTAGEITEAGASAEENAEQVPVVEENAERTPTVVQIAEASIPEVTPKVEEPPVVEGPAGVPAAPGMVWVQMPAPDQVVKAEGVPVVIRTPIVVPRDGPGDRPEDAIEIDDDDDEMEVDPPTAGKEGNSEEVNESEESPK